MRAPLLTNVGGGASGADIGVDYMMMWADEWWIKVSLDLVERKFTP